MRKNIKSLFYIVFAILFFILGIIGLILPVVPQIPFFIISLLFLMLAFPKFNESILNSKIYLKYIKKYLEKHPGIFNFLKKLMRKNNKQ